jgi:hypothetical protein
MIPRGGLDAGAFRHTCLPHEVDPTLGPYLLRETIDRVVPSNGPNPAATADG